MAQKKWEGVKKLKESGMSIASACKIFGVSRSGYYKNKKVRADQPKQKRELPIIDESIAAIIQEIIKERPTYGYRRTWAVLRFDREILINKKKVQRIMRLKGWQVKLMKRPSRRSGEWYWKKQNVVDPKSRVESMVPDTRWSTDLTKFYVAEEGWVNFIPVIDCCTRECVGKRISVRGSAREARDALEEAVLNRFGSIEEVPEGLSMRMDNGSIFLSKEYWRELKRLGIEAEFTPYRCPSANGIVERFFKTFKEECAWQNTFNSLEEAEGVIEEWITFYNTKRRHSRFDYKTPSEYRESLRKLAA